MPSLTKKNRGRCTNSHNSTIKILDRARSSPTNTMWSLIPPNQGYQRMRAEKEEEKQLKNQKTQLKNRLREEVQKIENVQNNIINAEKNKKKIASKYDEDYEDYDDEVASINETWKTCEGDYTHPLRKSPTMKNLKDLVGGKKYKKKTHKHRKKKKPIPYKRKSIKYK
jgi:hypothetical protein